MCVSYYNYGSVQSKDTELEALHEAIKMYGVPTIFNSESGSQYLSKEFVDALLSYGIRISNDGVIS